MSRLHENLRYYKPTEEQYRKFEWINAKSDKEQDEDCIRYDDCSICPYAIHQDLYSTTKHTCVQGMSKKEFETELNNADCYF